MEIGRRALDELRTLLARYDVVSTGMVLDALGKLAVIDSVEPTDRLRLLVDRIDQLEARIDFGISPRPVAQPEPPLLYDIFADVEAEADRLMRLFVEGPPLNPIPGTDELLRSIALNLNEIEPAATGEPAFAELHKSADNMDRRLFAFPRVNAPPPRDCTDPLPTMRRADKSFCASDGPARFSISFHFDSRLAYEQAKLEWTQSATLPYHDASAPSIEQAIEYAAEHLPDSSEIVIKIEEHGIFLASTDVLGREDEAAISCGLIARQIIEATDWINKPTDKK